MTHSLVLLQYLRGLAAILVAISHAQLMIPSFPRVVPYFFGNAGVYIFFAISGFLMMHITSIKEYTPKQFLLARILRVAPLYWVCTLGVALLIFLLPSLGRGTELSVRHLILSLTFIPHTTTLEPGTILPMLKVGWTLIYEMYFYGAFGLAMVVSYRYRAAITTTLILIPVLLFAILDADRNNAFLVSVYGDPIVVQFLVGMALAYIYKAGNKTFITSPLPIGKVTTAFLLVISFAGLGIADNLDIRENFFLRLLGYGTPCAVIVGTCLFADRLVKRRHHIPFLLGEASYSIYLIHMLPLAVFRFAWGHFSLPTSGFSPAIIFVILASLSSIIFGLLLYWTTETRLMKLARLATRP